MLFPSDFCFCNLFMVMSSEPVHLAMKLFVERAVHKPLKLYSTNKQVLPRLKLPLKILEKEVLESNKSPCKNSNSYMATKL